jgi:two-component system LytT family sensor kinase
MKTNTLLALIEAMSVFFVLFHLYIRSRAFRPPRGDWIQSQPKLSLYLFFTAIAIVGSYLGVRLHQGILANTRAVGAVLAGLLGGPWLGLAVGITAGAHRLTLGGFTAFSGAVATSLDALLGGLVHRHFVRRGEAERLVDWRVAFITTAVGETLHMGIVLALSRPFADAVEGVKVIGLPMIVANSIGTALFMTILRDRQRFYDQVGAVSSAQALRIAEQTLGILVKGFNRETAPDVARIIREQTGVGAVAITDTDDVLGFDGLGSDHHRPGTPIVSPYARQAIADKEVVFADGVHARFVCPVDPSCRLESVLCAPLIVDEAVIGTVALYEPRHRRFMRMNKTMGEGIAALLSNQLLRARYQSQKNLLVEQELKLVQAQVNPHFLFNSLNTIIAIIRKDAGRGRELLIHLASFLRKNLKRSADLSTLAEELEHVRAYLEIEKARFEDRLEVETEVDPSLLALRVPTFTLQPLIENAFKHGLSAMLGPGKAAIRAYRREGVAVIDIEDTAGAYVAPRRGDGLGMRIVDTRLKNLFGEEFGLSVTCVPHELTRVTVRLPADGARA